MCLCLQFQLQMFDIMCSTSWASRDKCCELPALVRNELLSEGALNITASDIYTDHYGYDQTVRDDETSIIKLELRPNYLESVLNELLLAPNRA